MYTVLRLHGVSRILRAQNLPSEPEWIHSPYDISVQVVQSYVTQNYSCGPVEVI